MSRDNKKISERHNSGDYSLRDMQDEDLASVLQIERGAQISPWSRLSFEESLNREHQCRVLINGPDILGYHVVCAVADELHVLNIVVAAGFQGNGLSHCLLGDIIETAQQLGLKKIFLEVRASNLTAQSLYTKWQFRQIALRKAYYAASSASDGKREDALIFMRSSKPGGLVA